MESSEKLLFELSPQRFEELSINLIETQDFVVLKKTDTKLDLGFDFQGRYDEGDKIKEFAVVVKHKIELTTGELERIFKRLFAVWSFHELFIVITSAKLTESHQRVIEKYSKFNLRIIHRDEILSFLDQNSDLKNDYFGTALKKIRDRRIQFIISITAVILSVIGLFASSEKYFFFKKLPLTERIDSVENALQTIKDLEIHLKSIKENLVETERDTILINEKYKKAKELESLTDEQIDALRDTLEPKRWQEKLWDWGIGLLLGIGGSLIASLIKRKFIQRKAIS